LLLIFFDLKERLDPSEIGRIQFCISSLYCIDRLFGRYSISLMAKLYRKIQILRYNFKLLLYKVKSKQPF
jgi:hypothetical protein